MYRISPFVRNFALALLLGAVTATLWVNLSPSSYYDFIEWRFADLTLPDWIWAGSVTLSPFMIVADMLMALFFFVIGKELWEAFVLERGALSGRKAWLPMGLSFGGMAGAALVWLLLSTLLETAEEALPLGGWQVPLGTDTVLVYLFARQVFGRGHPALHLALLLAIGTDILALLVLGVTNPYLSIRLLWLALPLVAMLGLRQLYGHSPAPSVSELQRRKGLVIWPYVIGGAISWFGVAASGMPGALGLLPMIPAIAHADRSFGLFAEAETFLHDPLNRLAHLLVVPVTGVLFLFGLIRGGVDLQAFAPTTLVTLGALWLGRPLGMALIGWLLLVTLPRGRLPYGVTFRDLMLVLVLMGIGFTVPAVAIQASLPGGAMQEAARMGLALSLLAGPLAMLLARIRH